MVLLRAARRHGPTPGMVYVGRALARGLEATIAHLGSLDPLLARDLCGGEPSKWRSDKLLVGAWASLQARLGALLDPNTLRTLGGSDIGAADFDGPLPVTVYLKWPDLGAESRGPLVRAVLLSLLREVLDHRDRMADHAQLSRLLVLLDEAGSLPLSELDALATTSAARHLSLWVALQSVTQLEAALGEARAQSVLESMHSAVYFRPSSQQAAADLSERIGQTTTLLGGSSRMPGPYGMGFSVTESLQESAWPLVPPHDLLTLPDAACVVLARGVPPVILERADARVDPELAERMGRMPPPIEPLPEPPLPFVNNGHNRQPIPRGTTTTTTTTMDGERGWLLEDVVVVEDESAGRGGRVVTELEVAVRREIGPPDNQGCRRWLGSFDEDGYPRLTRVVAGKRSGMHRRLYEIEHDEVLDRSFEVHHTCLHGWCMEGSHLVKLTHAEHVDVHAMLAQTGAAEPIGGDVG